MPKPKQTKAKRDDNEAALILAEAQTILNEELREQRVKATVSLLKELHTTKASNNKALDAIEAKIAGVVSNTSNPVATVHRVLLADVVNTASLAGLTCMRIADLSSKGLVQRSSPHGYNVAVDKDGYAVGYLIG